MPEKAYVDHGRCMVPLQIKLHAWLSYMKSVNETASEIMTLGKDDCDIMPMHSSGRTGTYF